MPTLTVNAEMAIHEDGSAVHLFVDGKRLKRIGPFASPDEALRAAQRLIDECARRVMPTLNATMPEDVSDEAAALMGQKQRRRRWRGAKHATTMACSAGVRTRRACGATSRCGAARPVPTARAKASRWRETEL